MRAKTGRVIFLSSVVGEMGNAGQTAYSASKAALLTLTRTMAREWAPWRVRVNAVSPGPIMSEMTGGAERLAPGFLERAAAATMQHRVAATDEIVGPVVYLASDASSFVTGEDHCVSGGMLR